MKFFKSIFLLVLLFTVSIFAAENADYGIIGNIVMELLERIPVLGRLGLALYGLILTGVIAVCNILLRRIFDALPVVWHEKGVGLFWELIALLFGDEVLIRNASLDKNCPEAAKEALRKRVIEKSPVLKIPVPWDK